MRAEKEARGHRSKKDHDSESPQYETGAAHSYDLQVCHCIKVGEIHLITVAGGHTQTHSHIHAQEEMCLVPTDGQQKL